MLALLRKKEFKNRRSVTFLRYLMQQQQNIPTVRIKNLGNLHKTVSQAFMLQLMMFIMFNEVLLVPSKSSVGTIHIVRQHTQLNSRGITTNAIVSKGSNASQSIQYSRSPVGLQVHTFVMCIFLHDIEKLSIRVMLAALSVQYE